MSRKGHAIAAAPPEALLGGGVIAALEEAGINRALIHPVLSDPVRTGWLRKRIENIPIAFASWAGSHLEHPNGPTSSPIGKTSRAWSKSAATCTRSATNSVKFTHDSVLEEREWTIGPARHDRIPKPPQGASPDFPLRKVGAQTDQNTGTFRRTECSIHLPPAGVRCKPTPPIMCQPAHFKTATTGVVEPGASSLAIDASALARRNAYRLLPPARPWHIFATSRVLEAAARDVAVQLRRAGSAGADCKPGTRRTLQVPKPVARADFRKPPSSTIRSDPCDLSAWVLQPGSPGANSTFNPWLGCIRVSPACDHCYAAALSWRTGRRDHHGLDLWDPHARRVRTSPNYWRAPLRWNWGRPGRGPAARDY